MEFIHSYVRFLYLILYNLLFAVYLHRFASTQLETWAHESCSLAYMNYGTFKILGSNEFGNDEITELNLFLVIHLLCCFALECILA